MQHNPSVTIWGVLGEQHRIGHSKKDHIMLYIADRLFSGIAAAIISGLLLAAAIY